MTLSRRHVLSLGLAALLVPGSGRAAPVLSGPAFGARWHAIPGAGADASLLRDTVARIVGTIDGLCSPYRVASTLARFNRSDSRDWQPVPEAFASLTDQALALNARTDGAFDPTVGPLVNRYGFGPIRGRAGGADGIETRAGAIRKRAPGLTLDLCGLAKGRALDLMIGHLARWGIRDVMLELGGEVRCLGRHPTGRVWRIGVEDPRPGRPAPHRIVAPRSRALATSGHARQSHANASHLIDPRAGRPADTRLASVTVLADSAALADGLATALAALGPEDGPAFAQTARIDAFFVLHDGGALADLATGRFNDHILA